LPIDNELIFTRIGGQCFECDRRNSLNESVLEIRVYVGRRFDCAERKLTGEPPFCADASNKISCWILFARRVNEFDDFSFAR